MKRPLGFVMAPTARRRRPTTAAPSPPFGAVVLERHHYHQHHHSSPTALSAFGSAVVRDGLRRCGAPGLALMVAVYLGFLIGSRRRQLKNPERKPLPGSDFGFQQEGAVPEWFNYALTKLWRLFQRNSKQLTQESIQPVLDNVEKPSFVTGIRLVEYAVGDHTPFIRDLTPVPARNLNEIQCTYRLQYLSTSDLEFEVDIKSFGRTLTIPVALKNMEIDASLWSSFQLTPYEPYCSSWTYALLETPKVEFDMKIGSAIPITAVPFLRPLFFDIISREIPKDFRYPSTNTVEFIPQEIRFKKEKFKSMEKDKLENVPLEELKSCFPEQWRLYDSLNFNQDNYLSVDEFTPELTKWGYSVDESTKLFNKMVSSNSDEISFPHFCVIWPNVTATSISHDYEGVMYARIGKAEGLASPMVGAADPIAVLSLGNETIRTASNEDRARRNEHPDRPVWNETFEMNCRSIENQTLEVSVEEYSPLALRKRGKVIGRTSIDLNTFIDEPTQMLSVDLEPQGSITLELAHAKFVDEWKTTKSEEDTGALTFDTITE